MYLFISTSIVHVFTKLSLLVIQSITDKHDFKSDNRIILRQNMSEMLSYLHYKNKAA